MEEGDGTLIAAYYYDPFGRRLWKEVGGVKTYFLYADEGLIGEYDASGLEIRNYGYKSGSIWTTDPLFMKIGTNYYFYHNDHLGTPQKMTAVNGAVVWSATYSSFGNAEVDPSSTITNNLRFAGQYFDEETGLHYNYFRYYNPRSGRYLTVDPIGLEGGINLFAYVENNPVNMIDPEGLQGYGPLYLERWGTQQIQRGAKKVGRIFTCTVLCVCGVNESDLQKAKNYVRTLGGATKLTIGAAQSWKVAEPVWKKVSQKVGKTVLKKVAVGGGVGAGVLWIYDIGRCSIKCVSEQSR